MVFTVSRKSTLDALLTQGKSTVVKGETDPKWSPNNIKTIVITQGCVWVEFFTVSGVSKDWFALKAFEEFDESETVSALAALDSSYVYSALEEIIFLVDGNYAKKSFMTDWSYIQEKLVAEGTESFLERHPRFYAATTIKCADVTVQDAFAFIRESNRGESSTREHYYDKMLEAKKKGDTRFLPYSGFYCFAKNADWWKHGIDDDKLTKQDKKRVLRGWLYALDAVPDENGNGKAPIYRVFHAIAKPYLDRIRIETEKKATADANKQALNKALSKDAAYVATHFRKFDDIDKILTEVQGLRLATHKRQLLLNGVIDTLLIDDKAKFKKQVISNVMNTGTALATAYTVRTNKLYKGSRENAGNVIKGMDKKAVFEFVKGFNYDYLKLLFKEYPNLCAVAEKLRTGGIGAYISDVGMTNDGSVVEMKMLGSDTIYDQFSAQAISVTKHYNTLDTVPVLTQVNEDNLTGIKEQAADFFVLLMCIMEAELYLAYKYFLQLIPMWSTSHRKDIRIGKVLQTKAPSGNEKCLLYNAVMKESVKRILNPLDDYRYERIELMFTLFDCAESVNGSVCSTLNEYYTQIKDIYALTAYLHDNIFS